MNLETRKNSIYFNISMTAIMCAINVIFVLITRFVPLSFMVFMFVLPSISVIQCLICKKIYFIPYLLVSATLCFLVNIAEISNTIFYIIPSLVIGFIIGFCFDHKVPVAYTFIIASIFQLILSYITVPIVNAIYGINIIDLFVKAFGLSNFQYINEITPLFMYFMAAAQVAIALLISVLIQKTLRIPIIFDLNQKYLVSILAILLAILAPIFVLIPVLKNVTLLLFGIAIVLSIIELNKMTLENKIAIILLLCSFVISLFTFLLSAKYIIPPFQILVFEIMIFVSNFYIIYLDFRRK